MLANSQLIFIIKIKNINQVVYCFSIFHKYALTEKFICFFSC